MIIWISGAYGVGKTTLAEALVKKSIMLSFLTQKKWGML